MVKVTKLGSIITWKAEHSNLYGEICQALVTMKAIGYPKHLKQKAWLTFELPNYVQ